MKVISEKPLRWGVDSDDRGAVRTVTLDRQGLRMWSIEEAQKLLAQGRNAATVDSLTQIAGKIFDYVNAAELGTGEPK